MWPGGGLLLHEQRAVPATPTRLVVSSSVCTHSLSLRNGLTPESHSAGCGEAAGEETVCCL